MNQNFRSFLGRNRFSLLGSAFLLLLVSTGIFFTLRSRPVSPPPGGKTIPINAGSNPSMGGISAVSSSSELISIHLSAGRPQPKGAALVPLATGEPLSTEQVEQILGRLPALTPEPGDQTDFRLPQDVLPPPRPGQTVQESFPPAPEEVTIPPAESGPLQVLRYAPVGEVPVAPFLSVTFNQPMVALATVEQLSAADVPVQVEPSLPGTWRWLGAKTLTFQYDSTQIDRLPKATTYRVTVPAGTKSATGGELAEAVEWTFTTPPPKVAFTYPYDEPQPLDPLFFIGFDQRVDPATALNHIQVTAGSQAIGLKLVSSEEIQADEKQSWLLKNSVEGRWVAFRAQEPLPADSQVSVVVKAGTPSAEGPLTTTSDQSYSFHTYAPLRIEEHGCSWGDNQCRPLAPFYIRFNNPLDMDKFSESMLTIDPELPGASTNIYGNSIQIQGASQGQTTYQVWLSGDLQDTFGQKLGQDTILEFKVGQAEPMLYGPNSQFVTLDPAAQKPVFSVYTINYPRLDVKVYAVQPSDWPAFRQYMRDYQRTDTPQVPVPGQLKLEQTLPVESASDKLTEVDIDLSPYMDGKNGQFIVIVQPPEGFIKDPYNKFYQTIQAWVQVTQIGLDAITDHSEMVVWATDLKNGAPLAGINIQTNSPAGQVATGDDGTVRFAIPSGSAYLVASQGADRAILPRSPYVWGDDAWNFNYVEDELRWYVFDDRQMYRPGEDVHVKGWLRRIGGKQDGDVSLVSGVVSAINYQVLDPQGNNIGNGRAEVNALGGFDFVLTLPERVNLGPAQLNLSAEGSVGGMTGVQTYHSFQIQEFRRPEFEVTARNETSGPYFMGDSAVLAVEAKYYAGGPLPDADVNWTVSSTPGHYEPPDWPDFTFGEWTPIWMYGGPMMYKSGPYYPGYPGTDGGKLETFTGKTDATGTHYLNLDFEGTGEPQPVSIQAQASVMDVNRQAWTGSTDLLVHPASVYIGLRSQKYFVERGTPIKVDYIVTDLDGKPVAGLPVEITAARMEWKYKDGQWGEQEVDPQTCSQTSAQEPATCSFETPLGGSYRITALVKDDQGRQNRTRLTRWVSGGQMPPARNVEQEQVTLIPDKESYQPGDTAQILVQSPFSPAEGLLTVSRNGILYTQRFQVQDGTATLSVPIEEKYIPNLSIQVDLSGSAPRTDDQGNPIPNTPARPAFATGQLNLSIPPLQRTLDLKLLPEQAQLEPGGETTLNLLLQDANGQPVPNAEVAVVVVDEAILALSNYDIPDPLAVFYSDRPSYLTAVYGRSSIVLANPQALANGAARGAVADQALMEKSFSLAGAEAPMAAPAAAQPTMTAAATAQAAGSTSQPIQMRTDFNPLATFAPAVTTGPDGRAQVSVKLPDNLTRYRIMAAAVDDQGNRFGTAESNLTARLPLMVRPSAPRFLNFGDRFELPVVLQNQTDQPLEVDVAVRVSNLELTGSQGLHVVVPANNRVEVRFPAAAQLAGTARIQVAAVSGDFADAATIDLPVYTPATTEAFATYGVIDNGAIAQPLAAPENVFPQYGGLEISTSSTALQALTDAVLYLVQYPYDCSEQIASRVLAIAALRDVLSAFNAAGLPAPADLEATVRSDIAMLQTLQNDDGGFPYWRKGMDSVPFNTIHVAHALYRASSKGFAVPADLQSRTMDYLRNIESHYPAWYDQHTRWTLSAYALYVRNLSGDRDSNKAVRLLNEAGMDNLGLDGIGWLWPVLQDASGAGSWLDQIRLYVNNHVVETAGAANFTTNYDDQNYLLLGSDRRTDAILLDALIGDNPQADLIPKLVNGLLAHRKSGAWDNTQENVFVLLALDRYFNTFEAQTPDFVARIWLGETYVGSHQFSGYTSERSETNVPMSYLTDPSQAGGTRDIIVSKEGTGRLYYRLGLRYAPTDLKQNPLDMGFVVQRVYEAVDNPDDVTQDADGTWHIKAGARVRVRLTMVADNRRYHVALTDPLPAGLEIINPDLAVSGSVPQDPNSPEVKYGWWWRWTWYEHQNLRDQRAEAFTSLLWDGVYQYTYVARATTPGTFVVPPAKAEEMYSPEVFGRTGSDVVIVE